MKPDISLRTALVSAFHKGATAAWRNLLPMLALEGAMALIVAIHFCWPPGAAVLSNYANWQQSGGIIAAALAASLAGGVLSELSVVYFRDKGRWSAAHVENIVFKMVMFFISGATVYEFYAWQAIWFGTDLTLKVLVPKILVDQFVYTVFWANPFVTLMTRWQSLRYSGSRLWNELDLDFILERMLPILVTNWMFWIPGVALIYSMPPILQVPLFILATAIWGLLLPAVAQPDRAEAIEPFHAVPAILPEPAE